MLRITIPAEEFWDEVNEEFIYTKEQTLQLEHSLVSLSKWESKWCKAFLGKQDKTEEEISLLDLPEKQASSTTDYFQKLLILFDSEETTPYQPK